MKDKCDRCVKVFQADNITSHYTAGNNGLNISAICQFCLEKYLRNTKGDNYRKDEKAERGKMVKKW